MSESATAGVVERPRSGEESRTPLAGRTRWVLWLVCLSQFLVILDASIINVALPSVAADLGFTTAGVAWVVNGYLLPFAGGMLFAGRLADLFGPRRVFVAGVVLFGGASLLGGLAPDPSLLVAARVLQGVGAALMAPATMAVINLEFTAGVDRARVIGAWSAAGGLGGTLGAVIGGTLTTTLSWRWVLLINVPVGAALAALALATLRRRPVGRGQVDVVGVVSGTLGLSLLVHAVMQSADHPWVSARVLVPLVVAVALLLGFVAHQSRRGDAALLPLTLLARRRIGVADLCLVLLGSLAIAMWYFTSLLLQQAHGSTPIQSGLAQTPAAVVFMLAARRAGGRASTVGPRALLLAGAVAMAAGFGWLGLAHAVAGAAADVWLAVLAPTVLIATGLGLAFPTLMSLATSTAPLTRQGVAGAVASTAQQVGAATGLAVLTSVAATRLGPHPSPADFTAGYAVVFGAAALVALAIAAAALVLPPEPAPEPESTR